MGLGGSGAPAQPASAGLSVDTTLVNKHQNPYIHKKNKPSLNTDMLKESAVELKRKTVDMTSKDDANESQQAAETSDIKPNLLTLPADETPKDIRAKNRT